ncbi:MAG: FAD binding domain-containing protein [Betaproteobacteria bacterium]|nr:FAD binding domain-containing protein [Betaproteobacteria bacterium]
MKPAAFDLLRAGNADEVVEALRGRGDEVRILAGGQSLMAVLNLRLAQPRALVDLTGCADLREVRKDRAMLVVHAAATQASVERRKELRGEVPLLAAALPWMSHPQIRSRGTICGSIAHADPAAELPLVLATLGGEVVLRRARGRRTVAATDFFTGMLSTARRPDELLECVRFPLAGADTRYAFTEFALRHGDFALVAIAVAENAGELRIGVGGVADRPVLRRYPRLDGSALDDALNELAWSLDARDDANLSAQGRRRLVRRLGRRAVNAARETTGIAGRTA